jgi:hypothetical protein
VGHTLIREYYAFFNDRRFADASEFFAPDAVLEHPPFGQPLNGPSGYLRFAEIWIKAFPDAIVSIERVEQRGDTICEVDATGAGAHLGTLDLGSYGVLKPSGAQVTLRFRQMLEIRCGLITFSSISFDMQDLIRKLKGATDADARTVSHIDRPRPL